MAINVEQQALIDALSKQLSSALNEYHSECTNPGSNPDKMDGNIKFYSDRVDKLRAFRVGLENEFARCLQQVF